ncbi:hypothetical protein TWF281_002138 [Arthrobotrys megalospora]
MPSTFQVSDKEEARASHVYFIHVLENVRSILLSKCQFHKQTSESDAAASTQSSESSRVWPPFNSNKFEILNIEEPTCWQFTPTSPYVVDEKLETSKQATAGEQNLHQTYSVDLSDDVHEYRLALIHFFMGLLEMRRYLENLWKNYQAKGGDLITTALITNTAIYFARSQEQLFLADFPTIMDYSTVAKDLFDFCLVTGEEEDGERVSKLMRQLAARDEMETSTRDLLINWLMLPCFVSLESWCRKVWKTDACKKSRGSNHAVRGSTLGKGELAAISKAASRKLVFSKGRVRSIFFGLAGQLGVPIQGDDETVKAVRTICESNTTPIWVVFAIQILVDIDIQLGDECMQPNKHLRNYALIARLSIHSVLKYHEGLKLNDPRTWPLSVDGLAHETLNLIETWYPSRDGKVLDSLPETMYKTLQQDGILNSTWHDIELLIPIFQKNGYLLGRMTQAWNAYRQIDLAFGATTRQSVIHPHKDKYITPFTQSRQIKPILGKDITPGTEIFIPQLLGVRTELQYTIDEIGEHSFDIVRRSLSEDSVSKAITGAYYTTKILKALSIALNKEAISISIDYITLHKSCWRMLRSINDECGVIMGLDHDLDPTLTLTRRENRVMSKKSKIRKLEQKLLESRREWCIQAARCIEGRLRMGFGQHVIRQLKYHNMAGKAPDERIK